MTAWMITGTSRGLGRALTECVEARGEQVYALTRDSYDQSQDRGEFRGQPIDVLVLNAAVKDPESNTTLTTKPQDLVDVFNVNVAGSLRVLQSVEHRLHEGSKVVFVSSQAGTSAMSGGITVHGANGHHFIPPTYSLAYRVSKAAENMLVRCAALDLASRNIITFAVDPGWIQTDMGGPFANMNVNVVASNLVQVIIEADADVTGKFLQWDGRPLAW